MKLERDRKTGKLIPEIWKDIEGYEGSYQISNYGRVKSLERLVDKDDFGVVQFPEKILHPIHSNAKNLKVSYLRVGLYKNKKQKFVSIHRLVGKHFDINLGNKTQINHKKGLKWDNRATQLEWVTPKENTHHAMATGLFGEPPRGEKNGQSKLTENDVHYIRNTRYVISRKDLAVKFGVSIKHIDRIRCKERWAHV